MTINSLLPSSNSELVQELIRYKSLYAGSLKTIDRLQADHQLEIAMLNQNHAHEKSVLVDEKEKLKGRINVLNHRLYGKKSEQHKGKDTKCPDQLPTKNRGQQKGSKGHGRSPKPQNLPVVEVTLDIPESESRCSVCHLDYPEFGDPEISEIYAYETYAYKKVIKRKKYKTCNCQGRPKILTAPPENRIFPKTIYDEYFWAKFLINKFIFSTPIERTCKELGSYYGLISPGTINDGLKRILPLFRPIHRKFYEKLMQDDYFHIDETYWKMFQELLDKANYKWYIWGVFSKNVRYYHFSPSRSTKNLHHIFSGLDKTIKEIVIVCDRFSSYKCFLKEAKGVLVILAFCWVHVRRDFLDGAKSYPELSDWMDSWSGKINYLFDLNKSRLEYWNSEESLANQSKEFQKYHKALGEKLSNMEKDLESELANDELHPAQRKLLKSLKKHWLGLTYFYERPYIKMDNNLAEREVRLCVVGRKNFYGSGSEWSAELSGMMYSFVKTYELWKLDAAKGIYYYLLACSENGGKPPSNLNDFLPWEMSEERKAFFREPINFIPKVSSA